MKGGGVDEGSIYHAACSAVATAVIGHCGAVDGYAFAVAGVYEAECAVVVGLHYDAYMADAAAPSASCEEYEVAGLEVVSAYACAFAYLCAGAVGELHVVESVYVAGEAGAVEAAGGCASGAVVASEELHGCRYDVVA